jgi:signal transduction histidine kinase/CheY-like chemotaxis protein
MTFSLAQWLIALLIWMTIPVISLIGNIYGDKDLFISSAFSLILWAVVFLTLSAMGYYLIQQAERNARLLADKNAEQDRLKTALADLSAQASQTETLQSLLDTALSVIAREISAGQGVIYLFDDTFEYFYLKAGYALTQAQHSEQQTVTLGEGIIGQVGLERKPILLSFTTSQSVQTATLNMTLTNSYTYPLLYKDQLVGVLELVSARALEPIKQSYLIQSISIISSAIFAAQKADATNHLLEQARLQAKELEVKADQIEAQNAELSGKKQLLERQARELELHNVELEQQKFETEKKAHELEIAQTELQKQNTHLQDIQQELEARAEQLAFANKYKAEFLANMSHELRTPLNAINVLAGLLRKNNEGNLNPKQQEQLNVIHYSGRDLLDMINDLLDLSKIEAGQMTISLEEVNLISIGRELKAMFSPLTSEKRIELDLSIDDQLSHITSDKAKIRQIIKNFLSNALKFTDDGIITIKLEKGDDTYPVRITVQDTGIGIPEDKLEEIFEHFRQADGSTARKYGGTGLGLSISRELATMLGGQITVTSEENQGSCFTLSLPMKPSLTHLDDRLIEIVQSQTTAIPSKPLDPLNNDDARKTILLIDDDIVFANLLMTKLSKMGYHFLHANNGREGLALAKEHQPDGILLDRKMPLIGGDETLKLLKRDKMTRHIPVDILSGDEPNILLKRCGAVEVWQKPLDFDQLESVIEGLLSVTRSIHNVVIIEDNPSMQDGLESLLNTCISGINLHFFSTPDSALTYLDHTCPTVVVIDLGLPNIQGLEMVDMVQAVCPNAPIVVYTSRDLTAEEIKQLRDFTDTIILKTSDSMLRLANEITLFLHRRIEFGEDCHEKARTFEPSGGLLLGKKILLVDDDVRNLFSISAMLEEIGIVTSTANNAKTALAQISANPSEVDLILTDIMMPVMDGYELIQAIRQIDGKQANIPIVAITARVGSEEKDRCLQVGANDYISKPVDEGLLIQILRYWLVTHPNI